MPSFRPPVCPQLLLTARSKSDESPEPPEDLESKSNAVLSQQGLKGRIEQDALQKGYTLTIRVEGRQF